MSRQMLFLLATVAVMVYFSVILFMLGPLHTAGKEDRSYQRLVWCKKLGFRDPPARGAVALASFPGSGNTWLRYLLQQSTGILTGSIYMDMGLYTHGFPAENVTNGSVLVVKTHKFHEDGLFDAAVLLMREPRDAILADFHRLHRGHLGTAPRSAFHTTTKHGNKSDWHNFVFSRIEWYEELYTSYFYKFRGPLHVSVYETLVRDTEFSLSYLLEFLKITVTEEDMNCALAFKEGIYRRPKKYRNFDPFTPEMNRVIERAHKRVIRALHVFQCRRNITSAYSMKLKGYYTLCDELYKTRDMV